MPARKRGRELGDELLTQGTRPRTRKPYQEIAVSSSSRIRAAASRGSG